MRRLSLGGALSAIGDAAYQYLPPVKVPVLNVRKAAPVDVAAAWDSADAEGQAAGTKFQEGLNASMKETLGKAEMAPWRRAELEKRHQQFVGWVGEQLKSDAAFFNSATNQNLIQQKATALLDPTKISQATSEHKMMLEDEGEFRKLGRLGEVAMLNGMPTDYTNNDFFRDYRSEMNPALMRPLFQKRYVRGQDGELYDAGEQPLRLDAPSGMSAKDAEGELSTLQGFIKPSSKEWGGTKFFEGATAAVQKLYSDAGGSVAGYTKADDTHRAETNAKMISTLTKRFGADSNAWREFVTPAAQQALIADQYKQVSAEQGGATAAKVLDTKNGKLDLGGGVSIPLNGSHLEVRRRLIQTSQQLSEAKQLTPEREKMLDEAYKKLYAHDLARAERGVSNLISQRLGLQLQTDTSDITRMDRNVQGHFPSADENKGEKVDIFSAISNGTGLNGVSNLGMSDGKNTLPFWSFTVDGNEDYDKAVQRISKNGDGTSKSVGELNKAGYTIYNAKTLDGIAWNGNGDAGLNKIKVLPGAGVVTLLPKDPSKFQRKTQEILAIEQEANNIRKHLKTLEDLAGKRQLTPTEQTQKQSWEQRRQANIQYASTHGYVPAIKMRAVANQSELPGITGYKNSMKNLPGFDKLIRPGSRSLYDLDNEVTDQTGVRSISMDEGKAAGLPDGWGPTDYVEFDIYVGHPNLHALGSESSVIRNTKTNNLNNQADVRRTGEVVDARYN